MIPLTPPIYILHLRIDSYINNRLFFKKESIRLRNDKIDLHMILGIDHFYFWAQGIIIYTSR